MSEEENSEDKNEDSQQQEKLINEDFVSDDLIEKLDSDVTEFNIGINANQDAGQSIFHVHIHLKPRRKGGIDNPQGGVRGVIPNKRRNKHRTY